MFDLYDKKTGLLVTVYGFKSDNHGYPLFLIRKGNQWVWRSAKHYITQDDYNVNYEYYQSLYKTHIEH